MSTAMDGRVLRANAQRRIRRAELLETALRVFARKGYHRTRVSDVIEEAGIARGTFYLYFESKSAIFLELLDGLLSRLRLAVVGVETGPGAPPLEEQLRAIVRRIVETVVSNRLLTTIIVREAVGLDAEVDARLREFYQNLLDYVRAALHEGQRLGLVRALDTEVAAVCILGSFKQVMEQCVMMEGEAEEVDADRIAKAVLDYNLRGALRGDRLPAPNPP